MQHELNRRDAVTAPATAKEFYELTEIMSALVNLVSPYTTGEKSRSAAKEVFEELMLRCRLVEAIGAFLRTEWVPKELRIPYERLLIENEAEVEAIQKLAEQRWMCFELQNALGSVPETIQ